jgi:hypothetical protein
MPAFVSQLCDVTPDKGGIGMSTKENKTLVRRLIEKVWNTSNYSELETLAAPSFAESTRQTNQSIRRALPDHANTIEDILAGGIRLWCAGHSVARTEVYC